MANITIPVASFNNEQVTITLTYNDSTRAMSKVDVTNNSPYPVAIHVIKPSPPAVDYTEIIDANTTIAKSLPRGLVFQYLEDDDGTWNLNMGDIEIYCRWPA